MTHQLPHVAIVGGGFGGLAAAKALKNAPVKVTLIDRTNHHLFQPLLYQVATSVLAPSQIGFPIRGILQSQKNTTVLQGEVTGVDKDKRCVFVSDAHRHGDCEPQVIARLFNSVTDKGNRNEFQFRGRKHRYLTVALSR